MKIINTYIGKTAQDELVLILEATDRYFVQYWDEKHAKMIIENMPNELAEYMIYNNQPQ